MLQKREVYILIIVATFLFLLIAFFLLLFVLYFFKKKKQIYLEKELLKKEFSQTLLQSQIEIQEQTLRHLSRELHDNLGQVASLIKINLTTLKLPEDQKATQKIEDTKELTRQLIGDIKELSVSLGIDRIADAGLVKALETETERLNKTEQFTAVLVIKSEIPPLHPDKAIILYRMAQEILNNTVKHSQAKQIEILLNINENLLILAFHDDGIGFNAAEKMNSTGAGLRNLKSRASLINAQLHVHSLPGTGTHIKIELPL